MLPTHPKKSLPQMKSHPNKFSETMSFSELLWRQCDIKPMLLTFATLAVKACWELGEEDCRRITRKKEHRHWL